MEDIPRNLKDAFAVLEKEMKPDELLEFRSGNEDDLINYHFGLGMWIRNNMGLWAGGRLKDWFDARGVMLPDTMSEIIITSFWRYLNGKPIDLEGQIKGDDEVLPREIWSSDPYIYDKCVDVLLKMREKPLSTPAAYQADVFRLIYIPTFSNPAVVRLERSGGGWRGVFKRCEGQGGYEVGELAVVAESDLSPEEVRQVDYLLEKVAFWEMPTRDGNKGFDGDQNVLEGIQSGKYHAVARWSPRDTPYAEFVGYLLGLHRKIDSR